jgi:hypothetical protein
VFVCEGLVRVCVVAYVNSMSWIGSVKGGGVLLVFVRVWFGARIMHKFFDHSLAWHWHVMCGHVHLRSQFGIVCERDLLSRFHALVSVKIGCLC